MRLAHYEDQALERISVAETQSVRDTMKVMSDAGLRLVPVLSADRTRFAGVVADGDLRRYLARGGGLDAPVGEATNRAPTVTSEAMNSADIRSMMLRRGLEYLPQIRDGRLTALFVLWAASSPQDTTAVIMAGGLGSRLAPLTDNCPKPLLMLAGKPILTHIIEHLRDEGVTRFILSVNYLGDMIVDHYGDGSALDVSIDYVHETMRMGTGGALGLIEPEALSDPFLCLNGDVLNDVDVSALRSEHDENAWDATMVVRDHNYTVPYGVVRRSKTGLFEGSDEKPTLVFQINAGIYMLSKSSLSVIPKQKFYDLPTLFEDMKDARLRGGTYTHSGRWIDIGNLAELERAASIYEGHKP